jgi:hypothetical protein
MMRIIVLLLCACAAQGALTPEQKAADFRQMAALYAKSYAPYEWKRDALGFDLMDLRPWIERARATQTDLEYMDLLVEYVASLDDAHCRVTFPFSFTATLGFSVDIYDWHVLVDGITRSRLPADRFPFQVGDELVSLDGTPAMEWVVRLAKYAVSANTRSTARAAAALIPTRQQARIPWAHEAGDAAEVVIRRANGALETYVVPWVRTGFPITEFGAVPMPRDRTRAPARGTEREDDDGLAPWQKPLKPWLYAELPEDARPAVMGMGQRSPLFGLPPRFETRLGRNPPDPFFSGVYEAEGLRIGLLRIPTMNPAGGVMAALQQLEAEISWMQANTDGLIVDIMRNPGGLVSYVEELCRRLIPYPFRAIGFEVRVTAAFLNRFGNTLFAARQANLPERAIRGFEAAYIEVLSAYRDRGRTGPLSLTGWTLDLEPVRDRNGNIAAYTRPVMVLVDEFSASGGDAFAATLQDNGRALLFGARTMGAGGSVVDARGANWAEASTRVTETLMRRRSEILTPDFPAAPYVENIGVRPDVEEDFMTRANLLAGGRPFVDAFTWTMVRHIRGTR